MAIQPYEVELHVRTGDGSRVEITRTEFAYGVVDAAMQAILNANAEHPGGEAVIKHVGPPAAAVQAVASGLMASIAENLQRIRAASVGKP